MQPPPPQQQQGGAAPTSPFVAVHQGGTWRLAPLQPGQQAPPGDCTVVQLTAEQHRMYQNNPAQISVWVAQQQQQRQQQLQQQQQQQRPTGPQAMLAPPQQRPAAPPPMLGGQPRPAAPMTLQSNLQNLQAAAASGQRPMGGQYVVLPTGQHAWVRAQPAPMQQAPQVPLQPPKQLDFNQLPDVRPPPCPCPARPPPTPLHHAAPSWACPPLPPPPAPSTPRACPPLPPPPARLGLPSPASSTYPACCPRNLRCLAARASCGPSRAAAAPPSPASSTYPACCARILRALAGCGRPSLPQAAGEAAAD
jgi:hypothetical protein